MSEYPVALVTGAGRRRVGNQVARRLAENGYAVAIHYFSSRSEAEQTADELRARFRVPVLIRQADLGEGPAGAELVRSVVEHFGRLDLVVTCASVWEQIELESADHHALERMWRLNTLATYTVAWQAGLKMIEQPQGGCIVLIGDWAVQRPYRGYLPYFVAKGAIEPMVRALAVELGTRNGKVRVNGIHPGPVLLPESTTAAERELIRRATLVREIGSPADVADAVLFFAAHPFVTGTMLAIDGGRSIYCGSDEPAGG